MEKPEILIIDDNPETYQTLEYILTEEEYLPFSVTNGKKAIEAVTDRFFNLALIDLNLPDMPGIDVLKKIKELSPETEAIIITGYASLDTAVQAMHDAAFSYVTKPIDMDYLLVIIVRALEKQKLQIDRKRAEEELEKNRRHLEQLVEERTAGLSRANAELARASRHKDEFLANMSHELRTPLNVILGYAQILKSDENLTERQREGLETIKSSGEHLLNLINEILDLSKIEAGQMELQLSEFHLPEFLKHIAEMAWIRAEQKGLSFVYESDPELPVGVRADEKRLREVLLNLLGNAVKFMEEGSVTFRVVRSNRFSDIRSAEALTTNICFQVEDTGIGIAPEKLNEIFLPFQQVGEQRHTGEGTGLGLAISRKLVEMLGAELHVKSTVGESSIFWFELDLPEIPDFVPQEKPYGRRIIGHKGEQRSVLVVDDEQANRDLLVSMLLPLGFKVAEAANGQECVEKALTLKPDLILLDLRMPVLDGFGATQQIRQLEEIHNVVIIAVSASVFEETRKRALTIGFNDFLIKPFYLEELVELLHTHLHLEWIYGEVEEKAGLDVQGDQEHEQLVPLPPGETTTLIKLARLGIAKEILLELDRIERLDLRFIPIVNRLRQLGRNYQFDQIIELLETKQKYG